MIRKLQTQKLSEWEKSEFNPALTPNCRLFPLYSMPFCLVSSTTHQGHRIVSRNLNQPKLVVSLPWEAAGADTYSVDRWGKKVTNDGVGVRQKYSGGRK